ncbi:RagB/SusD family nutrient uptake outer membrane protein [Chitinophagaceae bacterium LWZ2-11]
MNLHTIKKAALGVMLSGSLLACSKSMLQEDLYSQPGSPNLTGPNGAALLTNGVYGYVQYFSYFGGNNWLLNNEANTDEFFCNWGGTPATNWGGEQNFINFDPSHSMVQANWDNLYKLIAQCNTVLTQFSNLTDAASIQNLAQARFWRAYAYEKLYFVFGPVPLLKGTEDVSNGIARATDADMQSFIESELKAVENILPSTYNSADYGRPTKWAVKAFLARYYANVKNWAQASAYAKDVITNGGFGLQGNYQDIFSQNGNNEVILAVNHIAQSNRGNKYVALSMNATVASALNISGVSASDGYGMSTPFFYSFATTDKRVTPYNAATGKGIAISGILYNSNGTPAFGTVANPQTVEAAISRVITCKWPIVMNVPNGEDAPLNVPLLRLGETYLTYAEAQNELGNLGEAVTYINLIRARAGLGVTGANSQTTMRDSILQERGWELYHEGYRREDLLRAGKQKFMQKVSAKYAFYFNGNTMPWATDTTRVYQPIPANALLLNPLLKQNKGY